MQNKEFDKDIKKILENFEESYDPSSWDILASKMDLEDSAQVDSNEELIPEVKRILENYEEPVKEEHWQVMKEDLDLIDQKQKQVVVSKLVESVVVLLLVLTYFNYTSFINQPNVQLDRLYVDSKQSVTSADDLIASIDIIDPSQSVNLYQPTRPTASLEPLPNYQALSVISSSPHVTIALSSFSAATIISGGESEEISDEVNSLASLPIKSLLTEFTAPSIEPELSTQTEISDKKTSKGLWMSVAYSYDLNLINSSFDFSYLTSPLNSGLFGNSVGILLSKEIGGIQVESGLLYADKTYAPGLIRSYSKSSSSSYLESALDAADFQQVSIPVNIKMAFPSNKVWEIYTVAGVGFHAIMATDYTVSKKIQPSARLSQAVQQESVDLSLLPTGLAQGGSIDNNLYLTALVGVGAQANIKNDMAFFFQPQYQYNFSNNSNELINKVHSLNILTGLKFRF